MATVRPRRTVEQVLAELAKVDAGDLAAARRRQPDLFAPDVIEEIAEAVRHALRVDVDRALRLAEAAVTIANHLQHPESIGRSLRAKANALWFKNDLRSAVDLFGKAVTFFETAGREDEVGRTLSSSIQALALLGEYDSAVKAADRAREIFTRLNQNQRLARLEINVANIHHRQDRFPEALACYRSAYQRLLPYKDAEGLGVALHNVAVCLIMLNDFQEALESSTQARDICIENGMPLLARQAEYNIAYLFFLRGDYNDALVRLRSAREVCIRDGDSYHEALCNLDESEIYLELNLAQDAAPMAEQAMRRFAVMSMPFEQAKSMVNLAIATHRLGDSHKALSLFKEAKRILTQERNNSWQALISLYESMVFLDIGTLQQAKRTCKQALNFFARGGLERREIFSQLVLVRILIAMGQLLAAQQLCRTALEKLKKLQAPVLRFQAYLLMGRLQQQAGPSHGAYEFYDKARLELESLRSAVQGDDLKIAFVTDKMDVYEQLVQLCLQERPRPEQAFEHMEQAKSRTLADLVFGRGAPAAFIGGDGQTGSRLSLLRRELNWYYHRLDDEQNPKEKISHDRIKRLREDVSLRENEFLRLVRQIPDATSYGRVLAPAGPTTLEDVRSVLKNDTTLIEYFQVGRVFVAAIVTNRSVKVVPAADISDVTASLRMLELQMSRLRVPKFAEGQDQEQILQATDSRLRELYEAIFAPIAGHIQTQNVVVIPHGALHYLPFHALMSGKDYLADRLTISYGPSASIYAACQSRRVNESGPSLLLGVPDEAAPWINQEIQSVASVMRDPKVFLGAAATGQTLREEGARARAIHIATHGKFRPDSPMFSSILLGDGYLSLYDLYQMKLPVELITLSGCGTGLSEVAAGDELLGLTRGLLYAGAQAVVVSLWDIHDESTANFMSLFYRNLAVNKDRAGALRTTMIEVRRQFPHPYYWAPFVLIGNRTSN